MLLSSQSGQYEWSAFSKYGQMLPTGGRVEIDSCDDEASGLVFWILMIGADDFRLWNFCKNMTQCNEGKEEISKWHFSDFSATL